MRWLLGVAIVLLAGTLPVAEGGAQSRLNPLRQLQLTDDDLDALETAADHLYQAGQIGATEAWSNPASGNSGSARLLETFERDGLPCRRVEHVINSAKDAVPKRLTLATCRTADGAWKLI